MVKKICALVLIMLGATAGFASNKKAPAKKPIKKEVVKKLEAKNEANQAGAGKQTAANEEGNAENANNSGLHATNEAGYPKQIIGVRLGGNTSKVTSYGVSSAHLTGYTIGGSYQINVIKNLPVYGETGLYYTRKGYQLTGFEGSETKIHYIEIPATINFHFGKKDFLEVIPQVGGYISYGFKANLKTKISNAAEVGASNLFQAVHEFDLYKEKALKPLDAGLRFGMDLNIWKINVGFAYDLGMYWIDKIDIIYGEDELMLGYKGLKNKTLHFTVGYNF